MGHNGCDGSQASRPSAIGSGYRFSKLSACWVTVGSLSSVCGSCGLCATVGLVLSAKPTRGERRG